MPLLIRLPRLASNVQEPLGLTRIVRLDKHLYGLFQLYNIANPISIVLTYHILARILPDFSFLPQADRRGSGECE